MKNITSKQKLIKGQLFKFQGVVIQVLSAYYSAASNKYIAQVKVIR
jgi:hypothetical protein